jgi:hypothetical protein
MAQFREVQRAHKSDKITVAQAMKAWRKVEQENAASPSRSTATGRFVKKTASSTSAEHAGRAKKSATPAT